MARLCWQLQVLIALVNSRIGNPTFQVIPKDVWSLLFRSQATDMRPCNIKTRERTLRDSGLDDAPGLTYDLRTERYSGWGFSCNWSLCHSSAVSVSHKDSFNGSVRFNSAAFMHSDCENSTACWVSHIKQSNASLLVKLVMKRCLIVNSQTDLLRCSASTSALHNWSISFSLFSKPLQRADWQSLLLIRLDLLISFPFFWL